MNREEWEGVTFVIAEAWPWDFTNEQEAAYFFILGDYDLAQVEAAVKAAGGERRPSAGALKDWIEAQHAPMTWDEAWPVIRSALTFHHRDHTKLLAVVAEQAGPHAAGWVASYGIGRLMAEEHGDPMHGGAVLHRLSANYTELASTDSGRERMVQALAAGPRIRGELRRPSYAELLPGAA